MSSHLIGSLRRCGLEQRGEVRSSFDGRTLFYRVGFSVSGKQVLRLASEYPKVKLAHKGPHLHELKLKSTRATERCRCSRKTRGHSTATSLLGQGFIVSGIYCFVALAKMISKASPRLDILLSQNSRSVSSCLVAYLDPKHGCPEANLQLDQRRAGMAVNFHRLVYHSAAFSIPF